MGHCDKTCDANANRENARRPRRSAIFIGPIAGRHLRKNEDNGRASGTNHLQPFCFLKKGSAPEWQRPRRFIVIGLVPCGVWIRLQQVKRSSRAAFD